MRLKGEESSHSFRSQWMVAKSKVAKHTRPSTLIAPVEGGRRETIQGTENDYRLKNIKKGPIDACFPARQCECAML